MAFQVPEIFSSLPFSPSLLTYDSNGFSLLPHEGHLQGIQRIDDYHFIITKSDTKGPLFFIVKWEKGISKNEKGKIISLVNMNDHFGNYNKNHPSGIQMTGNIVAIGLEHMDYPLTYPKSVVVFYDLSDPAHPKPLSYVIRRNCDTAGTVGILKTKKDIFMVVGGKDTRMLDFYVSNGEGMLSPSFGFSLVNEWTLDDADKSNWIDQNWGNLYESLSLLMDATGFYLLACNRSGSSWVSAGEDWVDLYKLDIHATPSLMLNKIDKKRVYTKLGGSFEYGSGIHTDLSLNRITLYATQRQANIWYNPSLFPTTLAINCFENAS